MDSSTDSVWSGFFEERTRDLFHRFPGWYRAIVIDTNDPQRMGRVRFKMPELHNSDIKNEECPWAIPAPSFGGKGAGSWVAPIKDDIIWIAFEKSHPYGPIWAAAADPTRRKMYPLPSISGKTPKPIAVEGEDPPGSPDDYDAEYHPKDNRPMSMGVHDRYGHTDIFSAVGFFPKEHEQKPTPVGVDGVSKAAFESADGESPEQNKPDVKYAARITKYGVYTIHSDVGYKWKEEFEGEFDKDEGYESKRWKYFLKLLNEGKPEGDDQRRYEVRTRYGHKFEMRDVGWKKTRTGEYADKQNDISDSEVDERWVKLRSKGGHFFQMLDVGFDQEQDEFVKRLLTSETKSATEEEDKLSRDKRMIRIQTRYGYQMVFDDRGSDSIDATGKEEPRGNGWFVKGRRDNRGFFAGFNEKDECNNFVITTPKGKTLDLNDRFGFVGMSTDTPEPISADRESLYGVYWPVKAWLGQDPENTTYHLKMDQHNGYNRFKTKNKQGIEFRDRNPPSGQCNKSWAEMRDEDDRGLWFNADGNYAIWRNKNEKSWIAMDENTDIVIVRNETGKIQIIAQGDVELKSTGDINMEANRISMKANTEIVMEAGGNQAGLNSNQLGTAKRFVCRTMFGRHEAIPKPLHPDGMAPLGNYSTSTKIVEPHNIEKKKPEDEGPPCNENPTSKEAEDAEKVWEDNVEKRNEIADAKDQAATEAEGKADAAEKAYKDAGGGG